MHSLDVLHRQPLLSDPNIPPPDRIIPEVEKSRPPVYSPELTALLTNGHSRTTKALRLSALKNPPLLPDRADPKSEDARLLGKFSKRREANIRRRYFNQEWKKVLFPLQVAVEEQTGSGETKLTASPDALQKFGVRPIGMQGSGVVEEVEAHATSPWKVASSPHTSESGVTPVRRTPRFESRLPQRFVRRRFQELLGRLPLLTYQPSEKTSPTSVKSAAQYQVSLSPNAVKHTLRFAPTRLPEANPVDLAWLETPTEPRAKRNKQMEEQ